MKKSLIILGILAITLANAQDRSEYRGRVGINTDAPKASLHIGRHTGIPANSPQGMLLPHLTKEQRDAFAKDDLTTGLMIFNTKKNCIDWWNGKKWICTDGSQPDIPLPATAPIRLPELELGNSAYWFSSIKDDDYLSITGGVAKIATPTGAPSFDLQRADGTATGGDLEPSLNVQGVIPTKENAVDRAIPITVRNRSGKLPAFTTYASIPAEYTVDGEEGIVVLSWDGGDVYTITKQLGVKIYAQDKEIKLKQLDLIAGQGVNQMGFKMTSFKYPKTKAESEQPQSAWTGRYDLHLISGIPDRNFVKATTIGTEGKKYRHQFLYVPVMGPDGKIWLNNNLGADYANIHKSVFNPGQQAKNHQDHLAYGSLFQWGREANGHELMTWGNGTTDGINSTNYPTYKNNFKWNSSTELKNFTDNCPSGWQMSDDTHFEDLKRVNNSVALNIWSQYFFAGGLRIPFAGDRDASGSSTLVATGQYAHLWTSTPNTGSNAFNFYISPSSNSQVFYGYNRSFGFAVRCLKD